MRAPEHSTSKTSSDPGGMAEEEDAPNGRRRTAAASSSALEGVTWDRTAVGPSAGTATLTAARLWGGAAVVGRGFVSAGAFASPSSVGAAAIGSFFDVVEACSPLPSCCPRGTFSPPSFVGAAAPDSAVDLVTVLSESVRAVALDFLAMDAHDEPGAALPFSDESAPGDADDWPAVGCP